MLRLRPLISFAAALLVAACSTGAPVGSTQPSGSAQGSAPPLSGDVLTYRGDPGRSGVMPGPAPAGSPQVAWQFQADGPIESSPAVVGGEAILVSKDGVVHALDLASGAERWSASLGAAAGAGPLVVDGSIVVGDRNGILHALDASTGIPRWTFRADGPIDGSAAAVGASIFAATEAGSAYALDATSGHARWQATLPGGVSRSVAATGDVVVMGVGGSLLALSTADGSVRWRTDVAATGACGTPAVVGGLVYDATGLDGDRASALGVVAVDATTGEVRWRYASPASRAAYTPAVVGGRAIVVAEDGTVVSLDASTGARSWSTDVGAPVEALPAIVGSVVFVATNGHEAEALDLQAGAVLWRAPISGVPYAPTVSHGLVLVGTSTGTLFAIGRATP